MILIFQLLFSIELDEVEKELLYHYFELYFEKIIFYEIYDKEIFLEVLILISDKN
jgi:hypothetical protein